MPLRVLVDLLFFTGQRGGTETYAREIVTSLPTALPGAQFVALTNRAGAERVRAFFPGEVHVVQWVGADRVSWAAGEVLAVNRRAKRLGGDVLWSPANFAPLTAGSVPRVTTTHDVTYHAHGGADSEGGRRIGGGVGGGIGGAIARVTAWLMARAARTSDLVITGSRAAEGAIIRHIGIDPRVITVIAHGTNAPSPPADPWAELAPLGIHPGRPIVLSTGNRLPHKNFAGLLRAAATMGEDRPLVVIPGSRGADPLAPLVTEKGLERDVVLPGWVSAAQLEALYACASLYVCPSLEEGFGLPVIDAMRRGCVVLANDVPVLREVGGDVALYADATSPASLAAAIRDALHGDQTARREAGIVRAAGYTWERSAEQTARVLEAAAVRERIDR